MEEVFRSQKAVAHGELRLKYEKLIEDQAKEHQTTKEKLDQKLLEVAEESAKYEKESNIANEALRKVKLELKNALADVKKYKTAAATTKQSKNSSLSLPQKNETVSRAGSIESQQQSENPKQSSSETSRPQREEKSQDSGSKVSTKKSTFAKTKEPVKKKLSPDRG